ncbi:MAG TPA: aldose epimerase family protein [Hyphomicrobiales bacterium]|nr:aldose epimerase family protein [Hyphomicrobiales bacterium]
MRNSIPTSLAVAGFVVVLASQAPAAEVSSTSFGDAPNGAAVDLFTLKNKSGVTVKITEFGGTVTSIITPDREGKMGDIVLGHDDLKPYIGRSQNPYFGGTIGRYANRIAKGKFSIDGTEYTLATNNGENHLHGGNEGFDQRVWDGASFTNSHGAGVTFTRTSADGEEGYPGNVELTVRFTLTDADELKVEYFATTDKPTPINMTNHSYFNLSGDASRDVLGHVLTIPASFITPTDAGGIPTGELMGVNGTPFDFTTPREIGERIETKHPQIEIGLGYDHNWVLNNQSNVLKPAAVLTDPASGRSVEIATTEPAIQFYTGNYLDGSITGKGGAVYKHRYALCLEPQHYPDSPNHPDFPSTLLEPGETYQTTTVYKFTTVK